MEKQGMNVLSLFDGISCGQVALERAGISVTNYYASEIEASAIKVTQANYPSTIQLGDVTKIKAADLPKIDLIMGGSPCQGFSFAGKQLNFDDPRSALFFEFVRLKNELNPTYWLLENVKMKREYQDKISDILGCEPKFIDSADFSAQSRKRLYWTNIYIAPWDDNGLFVKDVLDIKGASRSPDWIMKKRKGRGVIQVGHYGANSQGQRLYSSEGKHPTLSAVKSGGPILPFILHNDVVGKATKTMIERLQTLPEGYLEKCSYTEACQAAGNGWTVDVIAHIFRGMEWSGAETR